MLSNCYRILIFISLCYFSVSNVSAQARQDSFIGKPVPALTLQTLDGKTYNLQALKGKTIVLNLFYSNCGFCQQEIPFLNELVQKYKDDKNIVFIAISSRDDSAQLRRFVQKTQFNFEIVPSKFPAKGKNWQAKTNTKMINENFGTDAFPTTMIVDKYGIIRFYKVGFQNTESFKTDLLSALEKHCKS